MSTTVKFHVLTTDWLQPGEQHPQLTMHHYGDFTEVVDQFFGDDRTIKSRRLPERCWLYNSDPEAETTEKRVGSSDEPLRYTTVKQVAKLKMPEGAGGFDKAMMAYFRTLAKESPDFLVILERW